MRIRELVDRTRISKQTIHHYINSGVLPRPRKLGKNSADYNDRYVDRIQTIKELQEHYYLPLTTIKKILKKQKKSPNGNLSLLQIQSQYFKPLDRLLPTEVVGKKAFEDATGLTRKSRSTFEKWKIITPEKRNDKWIYSHDNVVIGKLLVEMGKIGTGPRAGFDFEELKRVSDVFRASILKSRGQFLKSSHGKLSPEEMEDKTEKISELMSIYYYHLNRELSAGQS
ncbi:MAG: MerR family transcriptional regulator [Desulfobacterales bacterium]